MILPQVVKRILPPMGNEFITLVKDTSLAQTINVIEIMRVTEKLSLIHICGEPSSIKRIILCDAGCLSVCISYYMKAERRSVLFFSWFLQMAGRFF